MKIHIAIYFLFSIFVLISFNAKCQSINILQGVVVDSFSGEPIANASILVNKIIYQTNQYGKFGFSIEGFDSIIILVSNNNYIDKELIVKNSTVNIEINLIPITQLNQIRVSAKNRVTALKSTEIGLINIPMEIVKIIPNIGGEPDLLKAVQLIPGIKFGKEGTSNIFVRGGSQDQNLILLDDAVVYNPNHLFGFFSVFSPEAIKSFDLYKSGFPSKFGDRLSSILDIKIKEGNSKKNKTSLQVGLLSSSINNEGPIFKKRGSYFISLRSTVVDKFISLYRIHSTNPIF